MSLISVGIDHEHASLEFLERATVPEHEWAKVLRTLVSHRNIHEAVFLSTCLRTEVVAVMDRFHGAIEDVTQTLAEATGLAPEEFADRLTVHFDRGVASHLFEVSAGLKSVVPGEFEVLGQVRRAMELAVEEQTAGAELSELFQRAIAAGRRARSETTISRGTTSFAQASSEFALEALEGGLRGAHVVIIGAGQLSTGVARSLLGASEPLGSLTIVNRTRQRAEELRATLDDERVAVASLDQLASEVGRARLVVVAVETTTPVVTKAHLANSPGPVLVVDLGVPRAVAADVDEIDGVRRVDIGDLRERVDRALGDRLEAVAAARALVQHDVEKYLDDQRARGAAGIVRALREHFDEVVEGELERRHADLEALNPDQRAMVTSLVRAVVAKLAHRPTVALKEAAGTDHGLRLSETTRTLFDL